ncbi:MAG: DUF3501 family protein [Rhodospirillaceae bacterium]|nr:DUF3501 family protein [Rhodospirillaceae bacterium]MYH37449.1 DUF3501 family protein [Rhodospirillaceae bacterium]MYK14538.1 DUF3501 family protein [Rhodospirillaceae bacterium]MYK57855.1 DUF3501 family protein [Rhodospirillaceae bacterium]
MNVLTRADIMAMAEYGKVRAEKRREIAQVKRNRRVEVGPFATFYFENRATMWHQVHEMLFIEKGGEDQIADELAAYNPLIPNGRELVATVMIEIDDGRRRRTVLDRLGGFEETMFIRFGEHEVAGVPEDDLDRTTADGKASSVQFVHFPFTDAQAAAFKSGESGAGEAIVGVGHQNYAHMAVMPAAVRESLAADLD